MYFAFDTDPRPPPAAAAIQIPIFRAVDQQIRSSPNDEEEEYYEDDIVNKEKWLQKSKQWTRRCKSVVK